MRDPGLAAHGGLAGDLLPAVWSGPTEVRGSLPGLAPGDQTPGGDGADHQAGTAVLQTGEGGRGLH